MATEKETSQEKQKKKKKRISPQKRAKWKKLLKLSLIIALFGVACVLGVFFGAYKAVRQDLPNIDELENFTPYVISTLYSDDGKPIKEFAVQKRIQIPFEKIPEVLKRAIIATEDPRFYKHQGIDFRGILRAFKENIRKRKWLRRPEGGSTITQQLAKEIFLYPQQTLGRKLKEMYLSLQIEKKYNKSQILEMYCNQFYLGHGVYGVESASNLFFGKSVSDLNLEEAALIAGILRGPSRYSPYANAEETFQRRNHVINRMLEEGFITRNEAEIAKKKPITVLPLQRGDSDFGAYFFEEVRKYIEKKYGSDALYRAGLRVYTTLNPTFQKYAEDALTSRLRQMDKTKGWRKDKPSLLQNGKEKIEEKWLDTWLTSIAEEGEIADAIVLAVTRKEASVKVKDYIGRLTNSDIAWTGSNNLENLIKRGDIIQVKIKKIDNSRKELLVSLEQKPQQEAAFLAIDVPTGQIKAMIGGYSFRKSKFNRATQALRQAGSAIKPFLYTAALDSGGYSPATIIVDEPTEFIDKWTGKPWSPPNYDRKYKGAVTLRIGIEESRNIVTARLLDYISPQTGVDYCRKFGITSTIYPYISLSLGSFDVSLLELVSAYMTFPNKGVKVRPYFITRIEDKEGNILEDAKIESETVISPQIAYMMTSLLQGVVQRGTAVAASSLEKPLAGKTGTTNKFIDAWFIGFSPKLCAGVWVGNDTRESLGDRQSGAVAALPIWMEFFGRIIDDEKKKASEEGREYVAGGFEAPGNLSFVEIDRKTGLLATPICLWPLWEVFLPGTEPLRYCSHQDHLMILDYYGTEKAVEEHD